jgi:(1->4)-alpha-D-glucan 1-alpha-D-glucosylmutase
VNATYRLQLTPEFGFAELQELLPYFQKLGVSHLYLSPITEAKAGSSHGYDVIDHNEVRAEFGGREGFEALREAAVEHGLRLLLDFVPNHAAVGPANALWQDVLAYGPFSPYAATFDIDWHPLKPELEQKILLPFLGGPYGEVLDGGKIDVTYEENRFYARYGEHRFALCPATYGPLLEVLAPRVPTTRQAELAALQESYTELARSEREKAEVLQARLEEVLAGLEPTLEDFKGAALHELLERQFWRLAYWKTAGHEINYRRFFDVNELVALRMEEDEVFARSHRLLSELLAEEGVDGVRIDHVDGLFDPQGYLEALAAVGAEKAWVEKILASGEILPESWPVRGTTGYEFLNDVLRVLIPPEGAALRQAYARFTGRAVLYGDVVHDSKLLTMETSLAGELTRLSYELYRLSEADYHSRDFTLEALREALAEIIAAFPRYRTYLPHGQEEAEGVIWQAVAEAKRRTPALDPSIYDFIARYLLTSAPDNEAQRRFLGRFQQYTAPVAAKGVEDTAFYRYYPLVALCEVGGDADTFSASPQAFHSRARFRAHRYPENLLATATHDNKRGEDTRMRLAVLGELDDEWQTGLDALHGEAQRYRSLTTPVGAETVHPEDEYFFYQHLLALWGQPELPERLQQFMQKALREAKLRSSWINPNEAYEQAVAEFIEHMLTSGAAAEIATPLAHKLAAFGFKNSLVQLVLKVTTPGVPDFYQGSELLDLSLVDPDNRRPVDFAERRGLLEELSEMLEHPQMPTLQTWLKESDPRLKLYFTVKLLRFRLEHNSLFQGSYVPLEPTGAHADNLLAFAREEGAEQLVVVTGRFFVELAEGWEDTGLEIPEDFRGPGWREVLTGRACDLAEHFSPTELKLPAAVFFRKAVEG